MLFIHFMMTFLKYYAIKTQKYYRLPKTQIMYIVTKIHKLHISFFHLSLHYNPSETLISSPSLSCTKSRSIGYTQLHTPTHTYLPLTPPPTPHELNEQMCDTQGCNQSWKLKNSRKGSCTTPIQFLFLSFQLWLQSSALHICPFSSWGVRGEGGVCVGSVTLCVANWSRFSSGSDKDPYQILFLFSLYLLSTDKIMYTEGIIIYRIINVYTDLSRQMVNYILPWSKYYADFRVKLSIHLDISYWICYWKWLKTTIFCLSSLLSLRGFVLVVIVFLDWSVSSFLGAFASFRNCVLVKSMIHHSSAPFVIFSRLSWFPSPPCDLLCLIVFCTLLLLCTICSCVHAVAVAVARQFSVPLLIPVHGNVCLLHFYLFSFLPAPPCCSWPLNQL